MRAGEATRHNWAMVVYFSRRVLPPVTPIVCLLATVSALGLARSQPAPEAPLSMRVPALRHPEGPVLQRDGYLLARARIRHSAWVQGLRRVEALRRLHQDYWLHAVGAQLYTAWHTPITLKAVDWYGFEYAPFVPGGLDKAPLNTILGTIHHVGFNALRILFSNETVESNPVVDQGLDANPKLRGLRALDIMERIIQRAHRVGMRVILCDSRSEAGMGPERRTGLWYTARYPESAWRQDWITLATRFRKLSAFVGADLRNEPHMTGNAFDVNAYVKVGPLWGAYQGTYYHDRDWHYAAETMGNKLLAINPHLLIIVEGVQMYFDPYRNKLLGGLWGSNLAGVQYDPVVLDRPGQLVYSVHEYGPQMWLGRWFNPHTTFASLDRRWTRNWGYLLSSPMSMRAPVFVGEFGTCSNYWSCTNGTNPYRQGFWFTAFVQYMHAHPEVGWAYWALNPKGPFWASEDNFYSLLYPDWRRMHGRLIKGLAPLLAEPDG